MQKIWGHVSTVAKISQVIAQIKSPDVNFQKSHFWGHSRSSNLRNKSQISLISES